MLPYPILCIRFDIERIEKKYDTGAYGSACYQQVYKSVSINNLTGCYLYMGDSNATLSGRENVCIIGIQSSNAAQIQSIQRILSADREFAEVCASNPLVFSANGSNEPLVFDGIMGPNGLGNNSWAQAAYDSFMKGQTQKNPENILAPNYSNSNDAAMPVSRKKLSGGAIAWLIICLAANTALGIFALALVEVATIPGLMVLSSVLSFGAAIGFATLLASKKTGFYIIAACVSVAFVINIVTMNFGQAIFGLLNPLITWGFVNKLWDKSHGPESAGANSAIKMPFVICIIGAAFAGILGMTGYFLHFSLLSDFSGIGLMALAVGIFMIAQKDKSKTISIISAAIFMVYGLFKLLFNVYYRIVERSGDMFMFFVFYLPLALLLLSILAAVLILIVLGKNSNKAFAAINMAICAIVFVFYFIRIFAPELVIPYINMAIIVWNLSFLLLAINLFLAAKRNNRLPNPNI
ncbi:MAG: hypothetical protein FWG34_07015 [Oscillospiraceae bacterium]|nr:hypothetical protein [Oscillospiraceae bacterium]